MASETLRYLIIPGWNGSGPDHWQTHWEQTLPNATRVQQPNWQWPSREDWVSQLARQIEQDERPAILIAHSLGCITLSHWAANAPKSLLSRVRAALLVAPADVERPNCPEPLRGFAPLELKSLPFPSLLVGSDNDRAASAARAIEFGEAWGSKIAILSGAGHINVEAGFIRWDEGFGFLYQLQELAEKQARRSA